MNKAFVLLAMIFLHIVDDYYLQAGLLSSMKQKLWWTKQEQYTDKYKYDYLVALIMHAFSWSFMIMLPIAIVNGFELGMSFIIAFVVNAIVHGVVDDLKANKFKINLVQDQAIHVAQIILTAVILV